MKLSELLAPWIDASGKDCEIAGLCNDTRKIKPGDAFLAIPGLHVDPRMAFPDVVAAGASALLFEPEGFGRDLPDQVPAVAIPGLSRHMAALASRFYGQPSEALRVAGITGTNGKTTIAWQLSQAWALLGQKGAYIGTLGTGEAHALTPLPNTTPDALCVQQLLARYRDQGMGFVSMEVSSHALELGRVDAVRFEQAIFTNLSLDHLDFHGSMEAYARAKARLFETQGLRYALLNADDPASRVMQQHLGPATEMMTYGLHHAADIRAESWQTAMDGSRLEVLSPWGRHCIALQAPGEFNLANGLALFGSLLLAGFGPSEVEAVMPQLLAAPGRLERVADVPCVLVDYAHTPDALENVLKTLVSMKQGRVIVVFGCGGDRDTSKRPMMGKVAGQYADIVVMTSDNPRSESPETILDGIAAGLLPGIETLRIPDRHEAIRQAIAMAKPADTVLIAGKGHESTQEIQGIKIPFSDRQAALQALAATYPQNRKS